MVISFAATDSAASVGCGKEPTAACPGLSFQPCIPLNPQQSKVRSQAFHGLISCYVIIKLVRISKVT